MPELPEVETMRRGVLRVVGSKITEIEFHKSKRLKRIEIVPRPVTFRSRVIGQRIVDVRRIGKRVVIDLSSGSRRQALTEQSIVFEPRMTGLMLIADPPNHEHLRVTIRLTSRQTPTLLFWDRRGLGTARLYTTEALEQRLSESIGQDALEITLEQLRENLASSTRAIKVALLDQQAVAGIGNLYASEILFCAAVHPEKRCRRLTKPEWIRIYKSMRHVLNEAIKYEGSTLGDGTYRNALNDPGQYQNHHRVYKRAGQPCPRCGAIVQRIVQAQRSTFFCRACQRRR